MSTFRNIATQAVLKGERTDADEITIFELSELTLTAVPADGKVRPQSLNFPLLGVDFVLDGNDKLFLVESDSEDIATFEVEDEDLRTHVLSYLDGRADFAEAQGY